MDESPVVGIDPGTTVSGIVLWNPITRRVIRAVAEMENAEVRERLLADWLPPYRVVCEWIQAMGMPVGREVFETCRFIGRLEEICLARGQPITFIQRPTVKSRLCGSARAKDGNVRQALLDHIGPCGTKKAQGPLYGVSKHAWNALAVVIATELQ